MWRPRASTQSKPTQPPSTKQVHTLPFPHQQSVLPHPSRPTLSDPLPSPHLPPPLPLSLSVRVARSPADVALDCRVLITMLPSSPHVLDVYTNEKTGILSAFPIPRSSSTRPAHSASTSSPQPSTSTPLFIDSSTIDPLTARTLASLASDHSCAMVDAPVSGGINGAEAATLTFMVGGTPSAFSAAQSYLSRMGRNIVHCGSAGTGQTAKVCNNLVLAVSMAAVSEAMVLGQRLGMDAKKLAGIFNTSTARCWASDTYNPVPGVQAGVPSGRDYVGGFGSDLMRKDLGLAREAAKGVGMEVEMGERVWRMYEDIGKKGWGQKDFSIIYQHLMQRAQQGEGGQEAGKGDSAQPATEKSQ